jgi:CRISPR-associated protein Cmr5
VQAKGEAPTLVARLSNWVLSDETPVKAQAPGTPQQGPPSLLAAVVYGDVSCLRLATTETLAYLVWLNRFAEAGEAAARGGQAAAEGVG